MTGEEFHMPKEQLDFVKYRQKKNILGHDEEYKHFETSFLRTGKTLYNRLQWETGKCNNCGADLPRYSSYTNDMNEMKKCSECDEIHLYLKYKPIKLIGERL